MLKLMLKLIKLKVKLWNYMANGIFFFNLLMTWEIIRLKNLISRGTSTNYFTDMKLDFFHKKDCYFLVLNNEIIKRMVQNYVNIKYLTHII